MTTPDIGELVGELQRVLDDTEREYAQMPLVVRLLVRRGFARRTGLDFAGWRALLGRAVSSPGGPLADPLAALAAHYRGAPERARRGMGATPAQLVVVAERSAARAAAADALRRAITV